jgi:pantoate kinase
VDNAQQRALEAAHRAEVELGTGLGDAVAQSIGGAVIRETPGIGAFGRVRNFPIPNYDVCVCILGEGLNTEEIITSEQHRKNITSAGNKCLEEFLFNTGFDNFISLSNRFAKETGLLTDQMSGVLDKLPGKGSMIMLGNSVFVFGDYGEELEIFGKVIKTEISHSGARLAGSD